MYWDLEECPLLRGLLYCVEGPLYIRGSILLYTHTYIRVYFESGNS